MDASARKIAAVAVVLAILVLPVGFLPKAAVAMDVQSAPAPTPRLIAYYSQCTALDPGSSIESLPRVWWRCRAGEVLWAVGRWCDNAQCSGSNIGMTLNEVWLYCVPNGSQPPPVASCRRGRSD